MQPFGFIQLDGEDPASKNWRVLDSSSKFGPWVPTQHNITGVTTVKAFYQLYGPMCYYYINLGGAAVTVGGGGNPSYLTGLPYGPDSSSGLKTTYLKQTLTCSDGNGASLFAANPYAILSYNAGVSRINIPIGGVASAEIIISGWFFRNT